MSKWLMWSGFAFVASVFGVATWLAPAVVAQAANGKRVRVEPQYRELSAVMITSITVGNWNVECGLLVAPNEVQPVTPFPGGSDWLQNMAISLFNRTNKTIVAGDIFLRFPETGDGRLQPQRAFPLSLGLLPAPAAFNGRTGEPLLQDPSRKAISFGPGETLVVHFSDYSSEITSQVDPASLNELFLTIGPFYFEDGLKWVNGDGFYAPDPQHPGRFRHLDPSFYPGNRLRNWPPGYRY